MDNLIKRTKISTFLKAIGWSRDVRINSRCYFMFGNSEESIEDARQAIGFAIDLNPDMAGFFIHKPFPDSRIFTDFYLEFRENIPAHNYSLDNSRPWENISEMSEKELNYIYREAYERFYLRPGLEKTKYKTQEDKIWYETIKREILTWTEQGKGGI